MFVALLCSRGRGWGRFQLSAVLREAAPSAFAGLPSWANKEDDEEEGGEGGGGAKGKGSRLETPGDLGPAGSLARELRERVFELEQTVFELEGKLRLADESRLERGGGGAGGGDDDSSTVVSVYNGAGGSSFAGTGDFVTRALVFEQTASKCQRAWRCLPVPAPAGAFISSRPRRYQ